MVHKRRLFRAETRTASGERAPSSAQISPTTSSDARGSILNSPHARIRLSVRFSSETYQTLALKKAITHNAFLTIWLKKHSRAAYLPIRADCASTNPGRFTLRSSHHATHSSLRAGTCLRKKQESSAFRPERMCAPSMGAVLEVKVLPQAGHSERKEVQLREGGGTAKLG